MTHSLSVMRHHQQDFLKTFIPEPDWSSLPNEEGELPSDGTSTVLPTSLMGSRTPVGMTGDASTGEPSGTYTASAGTPSERNPLSASQATSSQPGHHSVIAAWRSSPRSSLEQPSSTSMRKRAKVFCGVTVAKDSFCLDHYEEMHPVPGALPSPASSQTLDRLAEYHEKDLATVNRLFKSSSGMNRILVSSQIL